MHTVRLGTLVIVLALFITACGGGDSGGGGAANAPEDQLRSVLDNDETLNQDDVSYTLTHIEQITEENLPAFNVQATGDTLDEAWCVTVEPTLIWSSVRDIEVNRFVIARIGDTWVRLHAAGDGVGEQLWGLTGCD